MGGFRGARGPCPPPKLSPNKFQKRPSGASRMQENLLAPDHAGGVYSTPPDSLTCVCGGDCPLPKNPTPLSALWASGFGPSSLASDPNSQNRSRGPSQHDGRTRLYALQWRHSCVSFGSEIDDVCRAACPRVRYGKSHVTGVAGAFRVFFGVGRKGGRHHQ